MKIELSDHEVGLIDQALRAVESTENSALERARITADAYAVGNVTKELNKMKANASAKVRSIVLLRAKLIQAQAVASEHEVPHGTDQNG